MSSLIWFAVIIAALCVGALVFRFSGRTVTGNAPKFRDMSFGGAFGYMLGTALLAWAVYYYFQPKLLETGAPNAGVVFFTSCR